LIFHIFVFSKDEWGCAPPNKRAGFPVSPPANKPIKIHPVKIEGDEVFVEI
jgi:hypothetical protein